MRRRPGDAQLREAVARHLRRCRRCARRCREDGDYRGYASWQVAAADLKLELRLARIFQRLRTEGVL